MKAIRCREWGAPDVLRLEEAESPSLVSKFLGRQRVGASAASVSRFEDGHPLACAGKLERSSGPQRRRRRSESVSDAEGSSITMLLLWLSLASCLGRWFRTQTICQRSGTPAARRIASREPVEACCAAG
jgi:hypothetical protein